MKKFVLPLVLVIMILALMLAAAAPALANGGGHDDDHGNAPRCTYVRNHGWHIVGGGQLNYHWYDSQAECEIALLVPTVIATLVGPSSTPTSIPTTAPTLEPTATENPTLEPSPTSIPTDEIPATLEPTTAPTTPPEVTGTPIPAASPVSPLKVGVLNCKKAWFLITQTLYTRDVGFRFFDNPEHAYCQVWLQNKYGINYTVYKALNP